MSCCSARASCIVPAGVKERSVGKIGDVSLLMIFVMPMMMHSLICGWVSYLSIILLTLVRISRRSFSLRVLGHAVTWSFVSMLLHAGHFAGCVAS